MPALEPQYMTILKKVLAERFVPFLPPLLGNVNPADHAAKQLRAFSASALHKLLDITPQAAAASVVDDFNDKGIDAIHYHAPSETLYLLQTKLKEPRRQSGVQRRDAGRGPSEAGRLHLRPLGDALVAARALQRARLHLRHDPEPVR